MQRSELNSGVMRLLAHWLLGAAPSIADVSLYAYTHVADQGGFDLAAYPAVRAWIERFPALSGYVPFAGRLKASDDRKV